jgi:TRAP-type mannitol/chloroaromatic compound transport system permease small subunit
MPATPAGQGDEVVDGLLKASRVIDAVNDRFGTLATWLVLFACVISTGNAIGRYAFNTSSNAWLEVQWYMFAAIVFFGAPHTLKLNEHVRVDVVYSALPERARIWIDIIGGIVFLLPFCAVLLYFTWPWFVESWRIGEMSSNAGGLIRWPVKLMLPLGFALLALQGISELIKRVAALTDSYRLEYRYETPQQ